jgi:acetyl esterase/lipase
MIMKTIEGKLDSGTTSPSPEIECWIPDNNDTGIGVIIFPGGGYGGLAAHEGAGYAECLCKAGFACFVVKYRLGPDGHRHPAMLEDGLAAIATVRSRADEFGVDPDRVGVMGSSAGGHLAAHTLVAWDQYESDVSLRPCFGVLCYPVIVSSGPYVNKGSMLNLCGKVPGVELAEELSHEKHVRSDTPPCFLWHTGEDTGVPQENSVMFASALREKGVQFELHLYQKGRHGLGVGTDFDWMSGCIRWISEVAG